MLTAFKNDYNNNTKLLVVCLVYFQPNHKFARDANCILMFQINPQNLSLLSDFKGWGGDGCLKNRKNVYSRRTKCIGLDFEKCFAGIYYMAELILYGNDTLFSLLVDSIQQPIPIINLAHVSERVTLYPPCQLMIPFQSNSMNHWSCKINVLTLSAFFSVSL